MLGYLQCVAYWFTSNNKFSDSEQLFHLNLNTTEGFANGILYSVGALAFVRGWFIAMLSENVSVFTLVFTIVVALTILILTQIHFRKKNQQLKDAVNQVKTDFQVYKQNFEARHKILQHINQEKDNFINILTHNLKTPISQIVGLVDILKLDKKKILPDQNEYLTLIQEAAVRMDKMINNLLSIEAIESRKNNVHLESVSLSPLLKKVIKEFDVLTSRKEIFIELQTGFENFEAEVDASYYVQIIENLLSNAVKFSPQQSKISVSLMQEDDMIVTRIQDQGPGISKEDQHNLFKEFQKLSASPTGGESSTGLGLAIVKKFTDAMDGEILIESELNQGTSFIVKFKMSKTVHQASV